VHMTEGETVAKALRRLGGGPTRKPPSSSQRWKNKKQKTEETEEDKKAAKNKEMFLDLTGLADQVLSTGNMEVYEMTYEKISYELKNLDKGKERLDIPEGTDADDALDMFADDLDKNETDKIGKDFKAAEKKEEGSGDKGSKETVSKGIYRYLSLKLLKGNLHLELCA